MKFVEIAMFLFILNMVIGFVNLLDLTEDFYTGIGGWGTSDVEAGRTKVESTVENQNFFSASLNWLVENVKLAIQGISSFMQMFGNATIFSYGLYSQLLCAGGVDCSFGSAMNNFILILYGMTMFVYTAAIIQLATGRSLREGI